MIQQLRNSETGQLVLAFALTAASPSAVIVTPFGLKLSDGISVEVDGDFLLKAPFRTCPVAGFTSVDQYQAISLIRVSDGSSPNCL